jgi:hypothetical protein
VYEVPPRPVFEDFSLRVAAMSASALTAETPVETAAETAAQAVPEGALETEEMVPEEMVPEAFADIPEIVVTPQVLEEPVAGMGWEPSSELVEDEESYEEFLPVVPDEFPAYEAPEVERTAAPPPLTVAAAAQAAAAEATVVIPPEPVVEVLAGDDLRARIEATRRRIREELEQPFAKMEEIDLAEPPYPVVSPVPEPVAGVPPAAAPPPQVTAGPPPGAVPGVAGGSALGAPAVAAVAAGPAGAPGDGDGANLEYEAMRARIEMTRSRLKAKAFDAMMAGESSLLGRDPNGAQARPVKIDGIDGEIEHKVETTLREQGD